MNKIFGTNLFKCIMAILSERQALLRQFDFIIRILVANGEENTSAFREIIELRMGLASTRCLNGTTPIPKNKAMNMMLWAFPERDFKQIVRMDKQSFIRLVFQIRNCAIFTNDSLHQQETVWIQLLVVLQRLGCDGNGSSIGRTARMARPRQYFGPLSSKYFVLVFLYNLM
jgi:hypothetical protein